MSVFRLCVTLQRFFTLVATEERQKSELSKELLHCYLLKVHEAMTQGFANFVELQLCSLL